jgi:hypothetical protein
VNSGGGIGFGRWRQSIAELLVGASVVAVVFAAIGATAVPILGAIALVGIALMLERHLPALSAGSSGPQPLQPPVESARPEPQARVRFDAALVDAMSV